MEGYGPSTYGDRFADVYDDWFADVSDVGATVGTLASLAERSGTPVALELGVGSGRLAVPLAARGIRVVGVDASFAMLARLRDRTARTTRTTGEDTVLSLAGDMAALPLRRGARFGLVFAAYNTLFNLASEAAQRACLAGAASLLAPGGAVVVEAFVPPPPAPDGTAPQVSSAVEVRTITADRLVLTASRHDEGAGTVTGQHVEITEAGIRLRPWHLRYLSPEALDAYAADAGLVLADRWSGWASEPFDATSASHVSVYARITDRDGDVR